MSVAELAPREDFERTPPHDIAAEQCVLGGMMLSKDAISDVLEVIRATDHYRPAHQIVHETILDLYSRGEPADAITVAAELTKHGDIGKVGGAPYLHTLIASVPTAANAGYYARIVRERAILRRLVEVGTRIVQLGYAGDADADELVERACAETDALSGLAATASAIPVSDLATGFLASLEAGPDEAPGVETPWPDLGRLIPGLRPGEVTVIGGRPGAGKSVALLGLAAHAALRCALQVLAVSLEMSRDEYMERLYAAEAKVDLDHLRKRTLTDDDWDRIAKAHAEIALADALLIHDGPALSVQGIRAEMLAMRRAGRAADLVIVDYMQLITPPASKRSESRQAEVSEVSRAVKLLAKEFGVPVVVGAQLNRGPEHRSDRRPMLADLRESGSVENDADIVILLYRDDEYFQDSPHAGEIDFIVAKNRQGPKATVTLAFQGHYSRIKDMAPPSWTPASSAGGYE